MPTPYTGQRAIDAALVHQARTARAAELRSSPLVRCAGPCGLTLPRDHFPRRYDGHGGPILGRCRACEAARKLAQRQAKKVATGA